MKSGFLMGLFPLLAEILFFQLLPKQVSASVVEQSCSKYFLTEFFMQAEQGPAALPSIRGEQCSGAMPQTTCHMLEERFELIGGNIPNSSPSCSALPTQRVGVGGVGRRAGASLLRRCR